MSISSSSKQYVDQSNDYVNQSLINVDQNDYGQSSLIKRRSNNYVDQSLIRVRSGPIRSNYADSLHKSICAGFAMKKPVGCSTMTDMPQGRGRMTRLAYAHMEHMLYRCWHYSGGSVVRHLLSSRTTLRQSPFSPCLPCPPGGRAVIQAHYRVFTCCLIHTLHSIHPRMRSPSPHTAAVFILVEPSHKCVGCMSVTVRPVRAGWIQESFARRAPCHAPLSVIRRALGMLHTGQQRHVICPNVHLNKIGSDRFNRSRFTISRHPYLTNSYPIRGDCPGMMVVRWRRRGATPRRLWRRRLARASISHR